MQRQGSHTRQEVEQLWQERANEWLSLMATHSQEVVTEQLQVPKWVWDAASAVFSTLGNTLTEEIAEEAQRQLISGFAAVLAFLDTVYGQETQ
ncbi:MAG: hypothetical protein HY535_08120 [Chloroflexi bacterium]|nr:hypothetical protein [Chloroflexota bacterium]